MKAVRCAVVSFCLLISGCSQQTDKTLGTPPIAKSNRVVLYCSVDDVYAKPIIHDLEKQIDLKIDVLYDTEAAKTAGLANRIRAEKSRPQGDVFWSSALLQTLLLGRESLLQPYISPSATDIPAAFKAKDGLWTGLGVRARVAVSHPQTGKDQWGTAPGSLEQLSNYPLVGISNPQFGTASDWVCALTQRWGKERTLCYFRTLKKHQVRVLPGNSVVAEKVARGELRWGVTDSDDYLASRAKGTLNQMRFPDTVFVPGSVAILKNAPHPENAKKLVDALLHVGTEKNLAETMIGVIPTRQQIPVTQPELKPLVIQLKNTPDDTAKWPAAWDEIRDPLAEILLKD